MIEKLLKMREQIDKAKIDINRLKGKREQLYETLKKDFNCETIEQAEQKLNKMNKELNDKELILKKNIGKLEERYDWN